MARWQLLAGPATGAPAAELTEARGRKVTFRLREPSTLSFEIDGRHPHAAEIHELATDVHLLRNGTVLYTGRVGQTADSLDETAHTLAVETADTRALLGRRFWDDATQGFVFEQGTLVRTLVDHTQARPGGNLGLDTTTAIPWTAALTQRQVETGALILDELQWLSGAGNRDDVALAPGFDWDISPGWTDRMLQLWYPQRGVDRNVVLDYVHESGKPRSSLIAGLTREIDPGTYANAVHVSGGVKKTTKLITVTDPLTSETSTEEIEIETPTVPVTRSMPGIATAPEGLWEASLSYPDVVEQTALEAKADERLAFLAQVTPSYKLTLRDGAWGGPEHIWLGDPTRVVVRSGRIDEDTVLRVLDVELTLGESGEERVALTVGVPRGTVLARLHEQERRLATIERRR